MQIQRTSLTTISPRALEELLNRWSVPFSNAPRRLRQPLGIYNLSLADIWESFREVLDELDVVIKRQAFRQSPPVRWDKTLMRRQEDLISHLMRHFDDCLNILCCFYPWRTGVSMEQNRDAVLKESPVVIAWEDIKPFRAHIANTMNHLKHEQGRLRGVVAFNPQSVIPGYFVEHINEHEVLEPDPKVHVPYRGESTAFSFVRDLRYKFWIVYAVSEYIAKAIVDIAPPTPNVFLPVGTDDEILEIARRISSLPKLTFKDEARSSFPEIEVTSIGDVTQLTLEFPSQRTILPALSGKYTISTGWVADGVTRSFKPPYFTP